MRRRLQKGAVGPTGCSKLQKGAVRRSRVQKDCVQYDVVQYVQYYDVQYGWGQLRGWPHEGS